jgi:hypothetical protein
VFVAVPTITTSQWTLAAEVAIRGWEITMNSGKIGSTIAAIVALLVAMPAASYETIATPTATQPHQTAFLQEDTDLWTLALLGPAAMVLFVTGLGLTITVRSLRADIRRRLELERYWRAGVMSRAAAATRE